MADMFDFHQASRLIEVVEGTAAKLDVQNGQMEARFGRLHDFFEDAGYDEFVTDMSAANTAVENVIRQMHEVSHALSDYAERIRESV